MAERKRAQARKLEEEARNWERGAEGERKVGAILDGLPAEYVVFHDLQIPGSDANVDHLVIGPNGVVAIDTKNFTYAVTRGSSDDELWTAKSRVPMRSCKWEAAEVARRIGVPVNAAMCIIAPSVPESVFTSDDVLVCQPSHVSREVIRQAAASINVALISERVAHEFSAEPEVRSVLVMANSSSGSRIPRAARRRPRFSLVGLFNQPLFRIALVAAGGFVLLALLPTIAALSGKAAGAASEAMLKDLVPTTVAVQDDSPSTTASEKPPVVRVGNPPAVPIDASCPNPGMGWTASFGWPGDLPEGAAAYSIRWQLDGGPIIQHGFTGWTDPSQEQVAMRIPNGAEQVFFTDYLDDDGQILTTTTQPFEMESDC